MTGPVNIEVLSEFFLREIWTAQERHSPHLTFILRKLVEDERRESHASARLKLESRKSQLRGQFLETRSKIRTKRLRKTPAESLRHASASSEAKDKPAKVFRQGLEPEDSFLAPRAIDFTDDLKYPETVSVLFCQIASYIIIKAFIAAVLLRQSANHKRN